MKPVISIIVPVYNVAAFIRECIDSILIQSIKDIEVILVNDNSSDNCAGICDEYALKDERIKVIHHKENKGVSSARNSGIDIANGQYIAFVDPDDTVDQNMYGVLLKAASQHYADITVCPVISINSTFAPQFR